MHIGLIDVDRTKRSKFPNLCLMKISAWHKAKGDTAELITAQDDFKNFDKVYAACVFDKNKTIAEPFTEKGVIIGGTGFDYENKLPVEVESMYPDYGLYGITDTAYGFLTRGCPRGCEFCIVGEKEGLRSAKVADLSEFWSDQKIIKLLDPNLLACADRLELLQQLVDSHAQIDFTQGLDIRLVNQEVIDHVNNMKIKMIHFAWDSYEFLTFDKLKYFRKKFRFSDRQMRVYVLTNFKTTHEQDLERVYRLVDAGYDPYIMIYDKEHAPTDTRRLQRWVNNKIIFRACKNFKDYVA